MKLLIALMVVFGSAHAMAEKMEVIVSNAKEAQTTDQIRYNVIVQLAADYKDAVNLVPMNLGVVKALNELGDGVHECEGERFKGQVFSLESCQLIKRVSL